MLQMLIFIYAVVSLAFFAYMLLRPFFLKFVHEAAYGTKISEPEPSAALIDKCSFGLVCLSTEH